MSYRLHLLLTMPLLLLLMASLVSCEESDYEKRERIKKSVLSQLEVPNENLLFGTRELSEVAKESLVNKMTGNKYMLRASFTVVNGSSLDVKDFQVAFSITAPSGTKMGSKISDTIYEIIPANGSRVLGPMDIGAIEISNPKWVTARISDFKLISD